MEHCGGKKLMVKKSGHFQPLLEKANATDLSLLAPLLLLFVLVLISLPSRSSPLHM